MFHCQYIKTKDTGMLFIAGIKIDIPERNIIVL